MPSCIDPALRLDHLAFGTLDVEAARGSLSRLGFVTTEIGRCEWEVGADPISARCVSAMLEDGYLDLIESGHPRFRRHVESSVVYGPGIAPSGIVLSGAPLEACARRLAQIDVPSSPPYDILRHLRGARPERMSYRILSLASSSLPYAIIRDEQPAAMRTPAWLAHPNRATGVARVHLRATDVLLAAPNLHPDVVQLHGRPPEDAYLRRIDDLLPRPDRPSLLAIEFATADLQAARTQLSKNGVGFEWDGGHLRIEPRDCCGCGVVFRSARLG